MRVVSNDRQGGIKDIFGIIFQNRFDLNQSINLNLHRRAIGASKNVAACGKTEGLLISRNLRLDCSVIISELI